MRLPRLVALWLVSTVLVALPIAVGASRTKMQSESERLIMTARLLEEKPLDKATIKEREWAIKWLIETDQVSVTICSLIASGAEEKNKYAGDLLAVYTIGMAAFKLSNPAKANDENAAQLEGVKSAIKSYEAIVREQPKQINGFMNSLIAKRTEGSLEKYVLENNCKVKR